VRAAGRRAVLLGLGLGLGAARPARADGSFAAVRTRGRLSLGLDVEDTAMCFRDGAGRLDGLAPTLGQALAEAMGVAPEFVPIAPGAGVEDLRGARFDLLLTAPAMTLQAARVMMFSAPYAALDWQLLAPPDLALGGAEALAELRVAQVAGWNAVFANRLFGRRPRRVVLLPGWRGVAQALAQGTAEAAVVPAPMAARITAALPAFAPRLLLGEAWMALAARFGDHDLLEALDAQLLLLRHRGVLAILHRHFLGTALPGFARTPQVVP